MKIETLRRYLGLRDNHRSGAGDALDRMTEIWDTTHNAQLVLGDRPSPIVARPTPIASIAKQSAHNLLIAILLASPAIVVIGALGYLVPFLGLLALTCIASAIDEYRRDQDTQAAIRATRARLAIGGNS